MKNARLRDRCQLQRKVKTSDFDPVDAWETYAEVWAERRDPKGDEVASALQTRAEMNVTFRIHYRPDVGPRDRLIFRGRVFNIRAVRSPEVRDRWLLITATEHYSDGD